MAELGMLFIFIVVFGPVVLALLVDDTEEDSDEKY